MKYWLDFHNVNIIEDYDFGVISKLAYVLIELSDEQFTLFVITFRHIGKWIFYDNMISIVEDYNP